MDLSNFCFRYFEIVGSMYYKFIIVTFSENWPLKLIVTEFPILFMCLAKYNTPKSG